MFEVIVPIYNGADNLGALVESVRAQSYDKWRMHISSDACTESYEKALEISERLDDDRINVYFTKKRQYALKNIVQTITDNVPNSRSIVAIIDGDDQLCDNNAFKYIARQYEDVIVEDVQCEKGCRALWTAHKWDDRNLNVSEFLPENQDPYTYPWVSSHLRTFRRDLLNYINVKNFKDDNDQWFKRGYDQALMLPILYYCYKNNWKTCYLPRICYIYNHSGSSTPKEEHTGGKLEESIANFIRKRGYVK